MFSCDEYKDGALEYVSMCINVSLGFEDVCITGMLKVCSSSGKHPPSDFPQGNKLRFVIAMNRGIHESHTSLRLLSR